MPNKTLTFKMDILPDSDGDFNLGSIAKKWIINGYTLTEACAKNITDNTTSTAPSSSDTNLITGRTLYNAIASTSEINALFV